MKIISGPSLSECLLVSQIVQLLSLPSDQPSRLKVALEFTVQYEEDEVNVNLCLLDGFSADLDTLAFCFVGTGLPCSENTVDDPTWELQMAMPGCKYQVFYRPVCDLFTHNERGTIIQCK